MAAAVVILLYFQVIGCKSSVSLVLSFFSIPSFTLRMPIYKSISFLLFLLCYILHSLPMSTQSKSCRPFLQYPILHINQSLLFRFFSIPSFSPSVCLFINPFLTLLVFYRGPSPLWRIPFCKSLSCLSSCRHPSLPPSASSTAFLPAPPSSSLPPFFRRICSVNSSLNMRRS